MIDFKSGTNDKLLVPWYLMSCYLYYKENSQVLEDKEFDELCHRLIQVYDDIEHPHKKLVTKENLIAQTGYNLKFPKIVMSAAKDWKKEPTKEIKDIDDLFE